MAMRRDSGDWSFDQDLLQKVSDTREKCPLFGTREGSRRGHRCKMLDIKDATAIGNASKSEELQERNCLQRIPNAHRYLDEQTDEVHIVPIPPIKEALTALTSQRKVPDVFDLGHYWTSEVLQEHEESEEEDDEDDDEDESDEEDTPA